MKGIKNLKAFDPDKKCYNVVIETPKGSRVKYEYLPDSGLFAVKRALPSGYMFPFNFGFIPSTLGEDGDPLDVLILNEEKVLAGCIVRAKLVAVIEGEQREKGESFRNDRLIGVAIDDEAPPEMANINFDDRLCEQVDFFFVSYNRWYGRKFKVLRVGDAKRAKRLVQKGEKMFHKDKDKKAAE